MHPPPDPPSDGPTATAVPDIAHFVFGLRPQDEPFHLVHYLAIASCLTVLEPAEVIVHCGEVPYGFYWDLIRPHITLNRVDPVSAVADLDYADPLVERHKHAHHADFIRLDALSRWGGLYADIDTLFLAPVPETCRRAPAALGRENDVPDPRSGRVRRSLSNAWIMAAPGSAFIDAWRERMPASLDGTWSAHSCVLATDLATEMPDAVHVEPQRTFHPFDITQDGFRRLLVEREPDLDGISSVHLAAHLWWEQDRVDFSTVHAGMIDEAWVRTTDCTYAVAARPFLPDHGFF